MLHLYSCCKPKLQTARLMVSAVYERGDRDTERSACRDLSTGCADSRAQGVRVSRSHAGRTTTPGTCRQPNATQRMRGEGIRKFSFKYPILHTTPQPLVDSINCLTHIAQWHATSTTSQARHLVTGQSCHRRKPPTLDPRCPGGTVAVPAGRRAPEYFTPPW